MANLIKRIAISTSRRTGMASIAQEFVSSSNMSSTAKTGGHNTKRGSLHELSSMVSYNAEGKAGTANDRIISFAPTGNQIKTTQEVTVTSEPNPFFERVRRGSEVKITGAYSDRDRKANIPGIVVEEARSKSLDSSTEVAESLKSDAQRKEVESDDEAALVEKRSRWGRGV